MGEWQDRQIGYGAICSMFFWVAGVGLILATIAGLLDHPWANLGTVLFMTGSLRTLLAALNRHLQTADEAYELGRRVTHLVRDRS